MTGGLLGALVSGDYNRQASDLARQRANRFSPPAGFVPAGFGNSGPSNCFGCPFNVPVSNSEVEFGYLSTGQTNLTVDFTADGIMTLTRTELDGPVGNHDPVQLTFSSLGFSNFAGIEQIFPSPPPPAVAFNLGSITGVGLTTPASNGPAGVISLRLTAYARRNINTIEFAQFRVSHTQRFADHAVSLINDSAPWPPIPSTVLSPARVRGSTCTCIKQSPSPCWLRLCVDALALAACSCCAPTALRAPAVI